MSYRVFFYTDSTGFVGGGIGRTKVYVGQPLKTLRGAMNKVNRLDNEYGGYKYRYEKY
jgi:hypothetical protein